MKRSWYFIHVALHVQHTVWCLILFSSLSLCLMCFTSLWLIWILFFLLYIRGWLSERKDESRPTELLVATVRVAWHYSCQMTLFLKLWISSCAKSALNVISGSTSVSVVAWITYESIRSCVHAKTRIIYTSSMWPFTRRAWQWGLLSDLNLCFCFCVHFSRLRISSVSVLLFKATNYRRASFEALSPISRSLKVIVKLTDKQFQGYSHVIALRDSSHTKDLELISTVEQKWILTNLFPRKTPSRHLARSRGGGCFIVKLPSLMEIWKV